MRLLFLLTLFFTLVLGLQAQDHVFNGSLLNVDYLLDESDVLVNTINDQNTSLSGVIALYDGDENGLEEGTIHVLSSANTEVMVIPSTDVSSSTGITGTFLGHQSVTLFDNQVSRSASPSQQPSGQLIAWPNPATEVIRISSSKAPILSYTIYNLNGQLIDQWSSTEEQISVDINSSTWAAGTYFIQMQTAAGESITKQLIKH